MNANTPPDEAAAAARAAAAAATPRSPQPDPHPTVAELPLTPAQRLEASRTRLRLAMLPPPAPKRQPSEVSFFADLPARIAAFPILGPLLDSLLGWWERSPLRPAAQMAAEASTSAVAPVARRHPLLLVLGAALAGALLVWARPWRWLFRSALVAGLIPRMASRAVSGLPLSTLLKIFGASMARSQRPEDATAAAAAAMAGEAPGYARASPGAPLNEPAPMPAT